MHRSRPRATCRLLKIKGLRAHTWSNFLSSLYNIFPSREVFAPFQSMHGKISRLVNAPRMRRLHSKITKRARQELLRVKINPKKKTANASPTWACSKKFLNGSERRFCDTGHYAWIWSYACTLDDTTIFLHFDPFALLKLNSKVCQIY